MKTPRYISQKDTAKFIRKAIKKAFPTIKFYVRSNASAIDIHWTDGPTDKQVGAIVGAYEGSGFDGMTDSHYHYNAWLLPDGSATIAKCNGTGTMHKSFETEKPSPDAELVSFGAGYVSTHRHTSSAFVHKVGQAVSKETGWTMPEIRAYDAYISRTKTVESASFVFDFNNQSEYEYFRRAVIATAA